MAEEIVASASDDGGNPILTELWGFYLLQAINNLDTKVDGLIGRLDTKIEQQIERLDTKIERQIQRLDTRIEQQIGRLDAKVDQQFGILDAKIGQQGMRSDGQLDAKLDNLRYWAIGRILAIILATGTIIAMVR